MSLRLISFKLCPFVQRSVILLEEKGADYDIEYVDLRNKPQWFLAISPRGKVPLLQVDDTVLFESVANNEYLDETRPPALHPAEPLRRAHNRAWTEVATDLTGAQFRYSMATTEQAAHAALESVRESLQRLEQELGAGPLFNGEAFALVDAAFAPAFSRLELLRTHYASPALDGFPAVQAYAAALLARRSVARSLPDDFDDIYHQRMRSEGTWLQAQADG